MLVGLAFNTKTLAAYLVVPGIAAAYLLCAPGTIVNRDPASSPCAGAVMLAVSFAWIAVVEATPASKRPYVGSSTNNTELGLTFEYNGFGRVEGQVGGPRVKVLPGARLPPARRAPASARRRTHAAAPRARAAPRRASARTVTRSPRTPANATFLPNGRYRNPIPFGSRPSPVRLFGKGLGDQGGWTVPFALFGTIALLLIALAARGSGRPLERPGARAGATRRRQRGATAQLARRRSCWAAGSSSRRSC